MLTGVRTPFFTRRERVILSAALLLVVSSHLWGWWQARRAAEVIRQAEVAGPEVVGGQVEAGGAGPAAVLPAGTGGAPEEGTEVQLPEPRATEASRGRLAGANIAQTETEVKSPGEVQSREAGGKAAQVAEMVPAAPPATATPTGASSASTGEDPISLNRAGVAELVALPGIGPQLARRIVEYREAHGPFTSVDELQNVPGIGPAKLAELRGRVTLP